MLDNDVALIESHAAYDICFDKQRKDFYAQDKSNARLATAKSFAALKRKMRKIDESIVFEAFDLPKEVMARPYNQKLGRNIWVAAQLTGKYKLAVGGTRYLAIEADGTERWYSSYEMTVGTAADANELNRMEDERAAADRAYREYMSKMKRFDAVLAAAKRKK